MKKLLAVLLIAALAFSVIACGDSDNGGKDTEKVVVTEKNIDSVGEALGLVDSGGESTNPLPGAKESRVYTDTRGGDAIELYLYDTDSEDYKTIEKEGEINGAMISAYKEGFVLYFPNAVDDNLVESFNAIEFE